jgi:hypothetical protein
MPAPCQRYGASASSLGVNGLDRIGSKRAGQMHMPDPLAFMWWRLLIYDLSTKFISQLADPQTQIPGQIALAGERPMPGHPQPPLYSALHRAH